MYRIGLILIVTVGVPVQSATFYPRSYSDSSGYSSTIANLNNNFPYGKSVSYASDNTFPEVTRYPNYSPSYGYSGYSTPGYTGYSSTRYPGYGNGGYSTSSYNTLYGGSSDINQGYNNYGSNLGSTYGSGSAYGIGSGSTYRTGYASGFSNYGTGSTLGGYGGSSIGGYSSYEAPFMRNQGGCVNRAPQTGIYVDSLMGMWYGVEYIQHLGVDSQVDYTRTCIVIHIAEPMDRPSTENQPFHQQAINAKFRQQYRHLRLLWDEAGYTTEYALYFRNDSAGYWHVLDKQNGTLASRENYQHFGGTVQVLKAVNDHLVLNFCQEGTPMRSAQLYSVLFSRNPGELYGWEIDAVHSMLQNKKLSTASRRMVCGNSADRAVHSILFSILTCALTFFIRSS